ncbi:MAG: MBL fold metallo-hydrolase [Thaumarchaeota archaeon]|nr:MBL fold metallo-hydrolase [Nitrososphaerota archaeon]
MILIQIPREPEKNFSYILADEETKTGALIDPGIPAEEYLERSKKSGIAIKYVVNTHSHWDHILGNDEAIRLTGAELITHKNSKVEGSRQVVDGDIIELGATKIKVIHTPGHSPDGICLLADKKLLTGDTLFIGECGRTDLSGGSSEEMYDSLFHKIAVLHDDIEVYPGHDYGERASSTIGSEKRTNYTLQPRSKEEFIRFMAEP